MRVTHRQLRRIILENLYGDHNLPDNYLTELASVSSDFVKEVGKHTDLSSKQIEKLSVAVDLTDDAVAKITTKAVDDWISTGAGVLGKFGLATASEGITYAAGMYGWGAAMLAVFSVVPGILVNTVKKLSTIEDKLRNQHEGYKDTSLHYVYERGMKYDDFDHRENKGVVADIAASLHIQQYTFDNMITQLAIESLYVKDNGDIRMKNDCVAVVLLADGVIHKETYDLISEEFKRIRKEIQDTPKKIQKKFYAYLIKKAKAAKGTSNIGTQAAKDVAEAGFTVLFPEANNIAGMIFGAGVDTAVS